ncbi:hypothetical protein HanIR_Chr11g0559331 [Helianthus annuus]|nr:hypothetical protein HanIR_Chr11g0559331 [Helianthus annuus]
MSFLILGRDLEENLVFLPDCETLGVENFGVFEAFEFLCILASTNQGTWVEKVRKLLDLQANKQRVNQRSEGRWNTTRKLGNSHQNLQPKENGSKISYHFLTKILLVANTSIRS